MALFGLGKNKKPQVDLKAKASAAYNKHLSQTSDSNVKPLDADTVLKWAKDNQKTDLYNIFWSETGTIHSEGFANPEEVLSYLEKTTNKSMILKYDKDEYSELTKTDIRLASKQAKGQEGKLEKTVKEETPASAKKQDMVYEIDEEAKTLASSAVEEDGSSIDLNAILKNGYVRFGVMFCDVDNSAALDPGSEFRKQGLDIYDTHFFKNPKSASAYWHDVQSKIMSTVKVLIGTKVSLLYGPNSTETRLKKDLTTSYLTQAEKTR